MSDFRYKTRGMTSPQGKAKVYFCCHPEDFSSYFPMISDEILRYQNCAVSYRGVTGEEKSYSGSYMGTGTGDFEAVQRNIRTDAIS